MDWPEAVAFICIAFYVFDFIKSLALKDVKKIEAQAKLEAVKK